MKKDELEKLIEQEKIKLDVFDMMNNTTLEDKIRWKKEEIIKDNCKCPNCKTISLTGVNPIENIFMCTKCGDTYSEEDLIK